MALKIQGQTLKPNVHMEEIIISWTPDGPARPEVIWEVRRPTYLYPPLFIEQVIIKCPLCAKHLTKPRDRHMNEKDTV